MAKFYYFQEIALINNNKAAQNKNDFMVLIYLDLIRNVMLAFHFQINLKKKKGISAWNKVGDLK